MKYVKKKINVYLILKMRQNYQIVSKIKVYNINLRINKLA